MAKTLKYERAILNFLGDYAHVIPVGFTNVRNQVIIDKKNHHYQLVRIGWHEGKHIHYAVFHFDIINGKVWVQQNRTDLDIADELEYLGIPEKDIVLAFFNHFALSAAAFEPNISSKNLAPAGVA